MTNTMADLRREVAQRLRETLHGREIDTLDMGMPELPHMLGVVTIGAISTDKAIKGSLLDPNHEFWSEYHKDVNTKNMVEMEIQSAIRSLREDETFVVSSPYGEEAGIWYCEVENLSKPSDEIVTECANCGGTVTTESDLTQKGNTYVLEFSIDCPSCDYSVVLGTNVTRQ